MVLVIEVLFVTDGNRKGVPGQSWLLQEKGYKRKHLRKLLFFNELTNSSKRKNYTFGLCFDAEQVIPRM